MTRNRLLAVIMVCFFFMTSGCEILPSPVSIIEPPEYVESTSELETDLELIAAEHIPEGTVLLKNDNSETATFVKAVDIDKDGRSEIFSAYMYNKSHNNIGFVILKLIDGNWESYYGKEYFLSEDDNFKYSLFDDVTGDEFPDLLLCYNLYDDVYAYEIFTFKGTPERVFSRVCTRADLFKPEGFQKCYIAFWSKDMSTPYVELLGWENGTMLPAEDAYYKYFGDVVKYYKSLVDQKPDNFYLHFYYVDAQVKAGMYEEALKGIDATLALQGMLIYKQKLDILRSKALSGLGEYEQALVLLKNLLETWGGENALIYETKYKLPMIFLDMGRLYVRLKDFEKAETMFDKCVNTATYLSKYDKISSPYWVYMGEKELERLKDINSILKN